MLDIKSKLILAIRDKHRDIVKRIEAEGNTILKNFMIMLENIFLCPVHKNACFYTNLQGISQQYHYSYPLYVNTNKVRIAVGSSNTPVNFNDYNLKNLVKGWDDIDTAEVEYDEENFKGTFKAYKEWTFASETDIWEAGLAFPYNSTAGLYYAMIDRIVLDEAFTVSAGKILTVWYILEFSKK